MDWLGSLSSIQGQLSSFKELLAESGAEPSDPQAELELAKSRIAELESSVQNYLAEISNLNNKNEELQVLLESAELRLHHAKEEYKSQLAEKETELTRLRLQLSSERGEPEGESSFFTPQTTPTPDNCEFASEEHSSVARSPNQDGTATWEELRDEVVQLRAELTRLRHATKQKKSSKCTQSIHEGDNLLTKVHLEKQIDSLNQKLLDADEVRLMELDALRANHSEHLRNLIDQLRETENEVLTLRGQLEILSVSPPVTEEPFVQLPELKPTSELKKVGTTTTSSSLGKSTKRKQRGSKKKKANVELVESKRDPSPKPFVMEPEIIPTDVICADVSPNASDDYEKIESLSVRTQTPPLPSDSVAVQTSLSVAVSSVQVRASVLSKDVQTDDLLSVQTGHSVSVQTLPVASSQVDRLTDVYPDPLVDDRSQSSDMSDFSRESDQFDDLLLQLSNEVDIYEQVVEETIAPLHCRTLESEIQLQLKSDSSPKQSSHRLMTEGDVSDRLRSIPASLKSKCDRLMTLRKLSAAKAIADKRIRNAAHLDASGEISPEMDGWQDDFPNVTLDETPTERVSSQEIAPIPSMDEKSVQTLDESEPNELLISELNGKIEELETQLLHQSETSASHIAELETTSNLAHRLTSALQTSVGHLPLPMPPSPVTDGSAKLSPPPPWPPHDPEVQLMLILAAEAAARDELMRARQTLADAHERIDYLNSEVRRLESLSGDHETTMPCLAACDRSSDDQQLQADSPVPTYDDRSMTALPSDIAYDLCAALDSSYDYEEWDAEAWPEELYELLQVHFPDRFLKLTATAQEACGRECLNKISELQMSMEQHTSFRQQAEKDLQRLLSTVSEQQEQLELISTERDQLQQDLDAFHGLSEQPPHDISDDDSRLMDRPSSAQTDDISAIQSELSTTQMRLNQLIELIRSVADAHPHLLAGDDSDSPTEPDIWLERIITDLGNWRARAERVESLYETMYNALQQKHAESQSYHAELQRIFTELQHSRQVQLDLESQLTKEKQLLEDASQRLIEASEKLDHRTSEPATSNEEARLTAEVHRLQEHLIQMEEFYTTESVNAETREVNLRQKLRETESRLDDVQSHCDTSDVRFKAVQTERDNALRKIDENRLEISALQTSLTNLQSVLDSFQKNQKSAVTTETDHIVLELQRARQNESAARAEVDRVNSQLTDQASLLEQLESLNLEMQRQTRRLEHTQEQVIQREAQIDAWKARLARMALDTDSRIDKILVKNLILSYFQLPAAQRSQGLRVLGGLLNFTDDEYAKVASNSGTIPRLFGWVRNAVSSLPNGPPDEITFSSNYPDKSFTELLLAFLEQESDQRSPLRLPTDHYTPELCRPSGDRSTTNEPINISPVQSSTQFFPDHSHHKPAPANPLFQM